MLRVDESAVRSGGTIVTKFVWWRRPVEGVETEAGVVETRFAGDLSITGARIAAPDEHLTATTRHEGVHVGSAVRFPREGCWEITGTAGDDALTFTVYVLPPGAPMPDTAMAPADRTGSGRQIIATHTTATDAWCDRAGGCGLDPLTLLATLGVSLGWLVTRGMRGR